jgi:outer membrane immunogenic protein
VFIDVALAIDEVRPPDTDGGRARGETPLALGRLRQFTVIANAADMSLPMKATPPAPPAYFPWTGFYIGGNVGSGLANTDVGGTSTGTFGAKAFQESFSASRSQHGPLAGGQLGINYEFAPHWVLGAEADIDWSNIKGSVTPCSSKNAAGVIDCLNVAGKIEDFGTGRARLGYVFDNLLVYGTGGFAWANETATVSESCEGAKCPKTSNKFAFNSASSSATPFGWSAGAGFEWRVLPNWLLRVEYLHLQFNRVSSNYALNGTATVAGVVTPVVAAANLSATTNVEVLRVGLSYLFNWGL